MLEAVIVAGPTCSGKSALALALAERLDGTVINADSMQVYRELRVLTARPTPRDEARVPHLLYGVRPAAAAGSVAWWRDSAVAAMDAVRAEGRLPILCGGTGMYFRALTDGLVELPDPGEVARVEARGLLAELGAPGLHARLSQVDPETAQTLHPSDSQRLARAWEVWRGTGRGLASWRAVQVAHSVSPRAAILLDPPRPALREAIATRFAAMLDEGAEEEVRALLAQGLDPALPAMRAHGVPELASWLRGEIRLDEARTRAVSATVRYTKRQHTWFAHHALAAESRLVTLEQRITEYGKHMENLLPDLVEFIRRRG